MQLYAGVIGAREAAPAQAAGGHVEVPAVLLHHYVRCHLARAEEAMQGPVNREDLGNTLRVLWVSIIPARFQLCEAEPVGGIAVHLIGTQMDERALWTRLARGLEHVESADRIGIEVLEGDSSRPIMGRLSSRVHNDRRPQPPDEIKDALPVPHVEFMVLEARKLPLEAALIPSRIPLGPEEHRALVVVNAVNSVAYAREIGANLAPDQTG